MVLRSLPVVTDLLKDFKWKQLGIKQLPSLLWKRLDVAVEILFVHRFLLKFYDNLKNTDRRKRKKDALICCVITTITK